MFASRSDQTAEFEVTIEEGGVIRLPQPLQDLLGVPVGDIIRVSITPSGLTFKSALVIPDASERLTAMMTEQGVSLDDLLANQNTVSEMLFKERYGNLVHQD